MYYGPRRCGQGWEPLIYVPSKAHIFFAHRALWGEIEQSRAQVEALAEICVIGVTVAVRIVMVHNGYIFLAAPMVLSLDSSLLGV